MEIKGYHEVNSQQVIKLNLIAFGWFLSPAQVVHIQKIDARVPDYFALYAVEDGVVQSQVGVVTVDTITTGGIEKIGYIWGVATRPSVARNGYAVHIMEEAERRMKDEGIRYSLLGTGKSWVAYDLYKKLGYRDITLFKRGFKKCTHQKASGITLKTDMDTNIIPNLFYRYSEKYLGFVKRPKNFLEVRKAWSWFSYDTIGLFYDSENPLGYFIASKEEDVIKLWEICCPKKEDISRCVEVLESTFGVEHIMVDLVDRSASEEQLKQAGFNIFDESWGILMAKDLKGKTSVEKISDMYGLSKNRFHMTVMDEY